MKRVFVCVMMLTVSAASLSAQGADPDKVVADGGVKVPGWSGRIDPRPASQGRTINEAKFVSMATGIHVTAGPAAIYWNPANARGQNYTVQATFNQTKASAHPEGYGLLLSGRELTTPKQNYLYFLVRQDGKYFIGHRANDSTVHKVVDWTAHDAVKAIDANGQASNALAIVVDKDKLSFRVNGMEVQALPRAVIEQQPGDAGTKAVAGIRVNHNLDVHVDGFAVTPDAK